MQSISICVWVGKYMSQFGITKQPLWTLPVITHKWIASEYDMPSKTISIETPRANANDPSANNPPGTWSCQDAARSSNGPQKNPSPRMGRIVRKILPRKSVSPGQISPNPTLESRRFQSTYGEGKDLCSGNFTRKTYVVRVITEQ